MKYWRNFKFVLHRTYFILQTSYFTFHSSQHILHILKLRLQSSTFSFIVRISTSNFVFLQQGRIVCNFSNNNSLKYLLCCVLGHNDRHIIQSDESLMKSDFIGHCLTLRPVNTPFIRLISADQYRLFTDIIEELRFFKRILVIT